MPHRLEVCRRGIDPWMIQKDCGVVRATNYHFDTSELIDEALRGRGPIGNTGRLEWQLSIGRRLIIALQY